MICGGLEEEGAYAVEGARPGIVDPAGDVRPDGACRRRRRRSTAFLQDKSPNAYEKVVDRLLASPHYGERWATKWLDVVRYADTNGYELDADRPHAWRYRDYVIRSFNADKPYDRFVKEQLAGDEMFPGTRKR